jgi:hypothetical protein
MEKQKKVIPSGAALEQLRAIAKSRAESGRIQRGISWPKEIDDAVTRAMDSTGMDRSVIVQVAVGQLLGLEQGVIQEPV